MAHRATSSRCGAKPSLQFSSRLDCVQCVSPCVESSQYLQLHTSWPRSRSSAHQSSAQGATQWHTALPAALS